MLARTLCPLAVATLLIARSAAAQLAVPMSSREQFLRVDPADVASPALVIPLADHGLVPGNVIRIETLGGFDNGPEGDAPRALMAVFSSSATLLAPSLQVRVPDAIDAGPDYVTHATCPGNLPTDIPEDFTVPLEGIDVEVPSAATHLFICPRECFSSDNADPNSDFGVRISLVPVAAAETQSSRLSMRTPWPSPMGSRCTISFAVPAEGPVRLALHGVDGRHVRTLLDDPLPAGAHGVVWDGTDERGLPVAGGVYFARLTTNQGTRACRLIVVR